MKKEHLEKPKTQVNFSTFNNTQKPTLSWSDPNSDYAKQYPYAAQAGIRPMSIFKKDHEKNNAYQKSVIEKVKKGNLGK